MKKIQLLSAIILILICSQAWAVKHVVTVLDSTDPKVVATTMQVSKNSLSQHPGKVTIVFDDKAIHLLDTRKQPLVLANGKTLHQEVSDFIEAGGNVSACSKCMSRTSEMRPKDMVHGTGLSASDPASTLDKSKRVQFDYYYD